jgi:DNA-binding MarR family transcriptional regulator
VNLALHPDHSDVDIYGSEDYQPHQGVGYLSHRVRVEFIEAVDLEFMRDPALAALQLTWAQYMTLSMLSTCERRSAAALCRELSYDGGAMTRMLDRLAARGLVRRSREGTDRRQLSLELTDTGKMALPRMRAAVIRVSNRFLESFTKAEARRLEGFLGRMLDNAHGRS